MWENGVLDYSYIRTYVTLEVTIEKEMHCLHQAVTGSHLASYFSYTSEAANMLLPHNMVTVDTTLE